MRLTISEARPFFKPAEKYLFGLFFPRELLFQPEFFVVGAVRGGGSERQCRCGRKKQKLFHGISPFRGGFAVTVHIRTNKKRAKSYVGLKNIAEKTRFQAPFRRFAAAGNAHVRRRLLLRQLLQVAEPQVVPPRFLHDLPGVPNIPYDNVAQGWRLLNPARRLLWFPAGSAGRR